MAVLTADEYERLHRLGSAEKERTDPMSGRQPFSKLTKDFPPERRQRINERKDKLFTEFPQDDKDSERMSIPEQPLDL